MDSPSMANSHGKQGLDKRHLPDRCIVDNTVLHVWQWGFPAKPCFGQHMYTRTSLQPACNSCTW
jgi:hypothetical protein